jgi:hypothetical protein
MENTNTFTILDHATFRITRYEKNNSLNTCLVDIEGILKDLHYRSQKYSDRT